MGIVRSFAGFLKVKEFIGLVWCQGFELFPYVQSIRIKIVSQFVQHQISSRSNTFIFIFIISLILIIIKHECDLCLNKGINYKSFNIHCVTSAYV